MGAVASQVLVSVIIPVRNGGDTLARCLDAAFASRFADFEVMVVDDSSGDGSAEIAGRFPCRLIRLQAQRGAAGARNAGAALARGELLFFTDADCLLREDTLARVRRTMAACGPETVVGGTYTPRPADDSFFSLFQSVFIHHSETRRGEDPDYLATHALAIRADAFRRHGGFAEPFLPILEDVEFSHRLRRAGFRLVMDPDIQVRHVFGFNLHRSLRNAVVKAAYWTLYSLRNRDLLADSGTASHELKTNVACFVLGLLAIGVWALTGAGFWSGLAAAVFACNVLANRRLLRRFFTVGGRAFAAAAGGYYLLVYPLAVAAGAIGGAALFLAGAGRHRVRR
jgi:GT2 family glycosyltransferase